LQRITWTLVQNATARTTADKKITRRHRRKVSVLGLTVKASPSELVHPIKGVRFNSRTLIVIFNVVSNSFAYNYCKLQPYATKSHSAQNVSPHRPSRVILNHDVIITRKPCYRRKNRAMAL